MQKQLHVNWVGLQKGLVMGKSICKQVENGQHELKEVVMDLKIKIGEIALALPTTSKNSWSVFEEDNRLKDCWCMQSHYVHCRRFWSSHANGLSKNREISNETCVIR